MHLVGYRETMVYLYWTTSDFVPVNKAMLDEKDISKRKRTKSMILMSS